MGLLKFGIEGYDLYREYIHRDLFVGILHAVFFPVGAVGFFVGLYGLLMWLGFNELKVYNGLHVLLLAIISTMLYSYGCISNDDFLVGGYFLLFHYATIMYCLYYLDAKYMSMNTTMKESLRTQAIYVCLLGLCLVGISLFMMEMVGHWLIEGKGSDVTQVINSINYTPLYGIKSVIECVNKYMK